VTETGGNRRRRERRDRARPGKQDRRNVNLGAPPASPWAHVFDLLFFRALGVALIANEVLSRGQADWHVLVAGFGAFFMPDWLRGRSSPLVRAALKAWIQQHGGGER
jgi:hypothetical protein